MPRRSPLKEAVETPGCKESHLTASSPKASAAPSRISARNAARVAQQSTPTEACQQDDVTFQHLVGDEAEGQGAVDGHEQEAAVETSNAASSDTIDKEKKKKKKHTSISNLQPKGEWKMYDHLPVGNSQHEGRLMRKQDRPNYTATKVEAAASGISSHAGSRRSASAGNVTSGKKPRGRPPKGMVWDDNALAYVSEDDAPDTKKALINVVCQAGKYNPEQAAKFITDMCAHGSNQRYHEDVWAGV